MLQVYLFLHVQEIHSSNICMHEDVLIVCHCSIIEIWAHFTNCWFAFSVCLCHCEQYLYHSIASVQICHTLSIPPLAATSVDTTESWAPAGRDLLLYVQHGRRGLQLVPHSFHGRLLAEL